MNDDELPGMWSHSDTSGGSTDCEPQRASFRMNEDQITTAFQLAARDTIPPMPIGHISEWWFRKGVAASQLAKDASNQSLIRPHGQERSLRPPQQVRLDYHFAEYSDPAFVGIFVTTREAYEAGEAPGADDVVQIKANFRDGVVCDLLRDAADSACNFANESSPIDASQALMAAARSLVDSDKAKNPAVANLAQALVAASFQYGSGLMVSRSALEPDHPESALGVSHRVDAGETFDVASLFANGGIESNFTQELRKSILAHADYSGRLDGKLSGAEISELHSQVADGMATTNSDAGACQLSTRQLSLLLAAAAQADLLKQKRVESVDVVAGVDRKATTLKELLQRPVYGLNGLTIERALGADWGAVHGGLVKARDYLRKDGVSHTWLDGVIGIAGSRERQPIPDAYLRDISIGVRSATVERTPASEKRAKKSNGPSM